MVLLYPNGLMQPKHHAWFGELEITHGHQEHIKNHHDKIDHFEIQTNTITGKILDLMMTS
jgi:hypothetical protein